MVRGSFFLLLLMSCPSLIFALGDENVAFANSSDSSLGSVNSTFSVNVGAGGNSLGKLTYELGIRYSQGHHLFSVRYMNAGTIGSTSGSYSNGLAKEIEEFAFMYGLLGKWKSLCVSASVGIGYAFGTKQWNFDRTEYVPPSPGFPGFYKNYYSPENFSSVGLAFDARVTKGVTSFLAFGIGILGDINSGKSYYGVLANLQIGALD